MKILLMGNPNVGKSALFSRLTGVHVICSNYPNTTVSYCSGRMLYGGSDAEVVDVPGTYSLNPRSSVEEIAVEMLGQGDLVVDVVDSTNLERSLYLALQLIESGKQLVVALNMWDDARHLGVRIDAERLEKMLGVPVVPTVAVTGEGVKHLADRLAEAKPRRKKARTEEERWSEVGRIIDEVQLLEHRHHTLRDRLEDASVQPATGLLIAALVMSAAFTLIINAGNWAISNVLDPFFREVYGPLVRGAVRQHFPSGIVHDILVGRGEDYVGSLGLLTTGVYVQFDMVLPFVILFYFTLGLLEDSGYLPRLATLLDTLMHRIGLHGSAIVPTILGLGCKVPGMLSTRMLESKKQRFIAATLLAICVPCISQSAVILGLLMRHGLKYVALVYATLFVLYVSLGLILKNLVPGRTPEILMELPPYRLPAAGAVLKKTWIRVRYYITDALPYVMLGVLVVNVMHTSGLIGLLSRLAGPALNMLFGLPSEAVAALIIGLLRKDVAVGMLAPLGLSAEQLTVASVVLTVYFPCIATYAVLLRELGLKDTLKSTAVMLAVALTVGALLRVILL